MDGGKVRMMTRVFLLIAVSAALTSCSSSTPAARPVGTPVVVTNSSSPVSPSPVVVTPSPLPSVAPGAASADDVALAGVKALLSSDTTLDKNLNGTARRAVRWLSPAFTASVVSSTPAAAPGAQWDEWAAHRAYVQVETSLGGDDHPTDSQASAARQVIATLTPIGRDGWRGTPETVTEFVVLVPVSGQWRVDSAQQR